MCEKYCESIDIRIEYDIISKVNMIMIIIFNFKIYQQIIKYA